MKIVTDFDEVYIIYYNGHNGEWSILDDALYSSEAEAIEKAEELNKTNGKKKAEFCSYCSIALRYILHKRQEAFLLGFSTGGHTFHKYNHVLLHHTFYQNPVTFQQCLLYNSS